MRDLVLFATRIEKAPGDENLWQFHDSRAQSKVISFHNHLHHGLKVLIAEMLDYRVSEVMVAMVVYEWIEELVARCARPPRGDPHPYSSYLDERLFLPLGYSYGTGPIVFGCPGVSFQGFAKDSPKQRKAIESKIKD